MSWPSSSSSFLVATLAEAAVSSTACRHTWRAEKRRHELDTNSSLRSQEAKRLELVVMDDNRHARHTRDKSLIYIHTRRRHRSGSDDSRRAGGRGAPGCGRLRCASEKVVAQWAPSVKRNAATGAPHSYCSAGQQLRLVLLSEFANSRRSRQTRCKRVGGKNMIHSVGAAVGPLCALA